MEIDQRKEKVTKNEKTEQTKSQTDNQPPIQEPQQTEQILEFKHKEGLLKILQRNYVLFKKYYLIDNDITCVCVNL